MSRHTRDAAVKALDQYDSEIEELEQTIAELRAETRSLERQLEEKDNAIERLESQLYSL